MEAELGSVLLDVRDASEQPAVPTRTTVDGAPLVDALPGAPVDLDPGRHTLVFEDGAGGRVQAEVTLATGEKGRRVSVRFPARAAPVPPAVPALPVTRGGHSAAAYVLGATGLAGLSVGAVLGIKGQVQRAALEQSCAPRCDRATQVDPIAAEWWGGAAAALVGGALLGAGGVVWLVEGRPAGTAVTVGVAPGPGWVGVVGRF